MKKFISLLYIGFLAVVLCGCSAGVSVGRHHPHGATVSAKAHGPHRGVHAEAY